MQCTPDLRLFAAYANSLTELGLAVLSLIISLATVTVVWIFVASAFGLNPLGPGTGQRSDLGDSSAFPTLESTYSSEGTTEDPYDEYYRSHLYEVNPYYGTFSGFTGGRSFDGEVAASTAASRLFRTGKALLDRSADMDCSYGTSVALR